MLHFFDGRQFKSGYVFFGHIILGYDFTFITMAESGDKMDTLPSLYDEIWKIWEFLETTDEPSVSYTVQV